MVDFNPFSPEFRANPYPTYAALRRDDPIHRGVAGNESFYALSRYDDVVHVLKEPLLFSSSSIGINIRGKPTTTIINADPPLHTRLRNMVNRAFTPRMVADMEPRIRVITRDLLDGVAPAGAMDVTRDLAIPLPVTVIAEILGIEPERRDDFKRWSSAVLSEQELTPPDQREGVEFAIGELQDYLEFVIDARRKEPRDDLISALVLAAASEEQPLTQDELLAFCVLLLIAGNETTTNLIGNAVLALLEHPDEMVRVIADPSLVSNLVEEALRWDSPVQYLFRKATRDTEIAGVPVSEGSLVVPMFASANRDEAKYPDPDRFDVMRNTQGHVAFGHGVHFCLGAPLARLEASVALEQVLVRMPRLAREDAPVERVNSLFLRGPAKLPVTFEQSTVSV